VEYLNTPDDGNHIWAKRRASDGHPMPWNVVWFEYGNETDLGDGKGRTMDAEQYAKNYLVYRQSMNSIDRRIKLGVVGTDLDKWLRPVLKTIGKNADFIVHHFYKPVYDRNDSILSLACEEQIQTFYDDMNGVIDDLSGSHIPIAVTEYNGSFTQEKPVKYRFTLGNALLNAEMIKVFLNPRNNIVMANSWQFSNEYWGAVKGYTYKHERLVKRPLFYVFQLYHEHFGAELIETNVKCDTYDTDGGFGVEPAKGDGRRFQLMPDMVTLPDKWQFSLGLNFSQRIERDTLIVEFKGQDVNYFHAYKTFAADPSVSYQATAWIKTEGVTSTNGVCIELLDARGWNATKSARASSNIVGTSNWQKVEVDYTPLPDAKEIEIRARRISGAGPISGRVCFRDVTVQKFIPRVYPAVPYLSVNASRSILLGSDGKSKKTKVYLMVVNRNMKTAISTQIHLAGMTPQKAKAWFLTGPSVDATNEQDPNNVSVQEHDYGKVKNGFFVSFPPHSLTALEIE
jgi:alpha-N-arabinofuranosidase